MFRTIKRYVLKEKRLLVVIDGGYVYRLRMKMNLEKLIKLASFHAGARPYDIVWFNGRNKEGKDHSFIYNIEAAGVRTALFETKVRSHKCLGCGHVHEKNVQKGVDIAIAMEIIGELNKKRFDEVILVSGDADFVPVAKLVREAKKDFTIMAANENISFDLRHNSSKVIELDEYLWICEHQADKDKDYSAANDAWEQIEKALRY